MNIVIFLGHRRTPAVCHMGAKNLIQITQNTPKLDISQQTTVYVSALKENRCVFFSFCLHQHKVWTPAQTRSCFGSDDSILPFANHKGTLAVRVCVFFL